MADGSSAAPASRFFAAMAEAANAPDHTGRRLHELRILGLEPSIGTPAHGHFNLANEVVSRHVVPEDVVPVATAFLRRAEFDAHARDAAQPNPRDAGRVRRQAQESVEI